MDEQQKMNLLAAKKQQNNQIIKDYCNHCVNEGKEDICSKCLYYTFRILRNYFEPKNITA